MGNYMQLDVTDVVKKYRYAFIGCRIEDVTSKITKILLEEPVELKDTKSNHNNNYVITAKRRPRERPQPVDQIKNSGNLHSKTSKSASGGKSPIRVRNVQTLHNVVFIRCLIMDGPYDVYYMVRPESKERKDPDEKTIMRYGEKAGSFENTSFDIVLTDYVMSVKNVVYLIAVRGKIILGPTKRGFFA